MARYHRSDIHYGDDWNSQQESSFAHPTCEWVSSNTTCISMSDADTSSSNIIQFASDCPLGPDAYPSEPPHLLPEWLGRMEQAKCDLESTRITDFSWPGTHDSLSYDLSLTISKDGLDHFTWLSDILHTLSKGNLHLLPGELEEFFRSQAKTQQLTITQQLDNGIRFLDLRLMYESDEWYAIHFLQSKQPIRVYWAEIRAWLDAHPTELVLVWLSRHGNPTQTGDDQYPNVPVATKQAAWRLYEDTMQGLLVNTTRHPLPLNETSIADLLRDNARVITLVADYQEFTGGSRLALDAGQVLQNRWDASGGVLDLQTTLEKHCDYFRQASANNRHVQAQGGLSLLAMNTASNTWQVLVSAQKRFLGWSVVPSHKCRVDTDNVTASWCPPSVLDLGQLSSFYNQIVLDGDRARTTFPHALYLDVLDYNGTIRTGSQLLDGTIRGDHSLHQQFAYVDTLLRYNAQQAGGCSTALLDELGRRIATYPAKYWDEPELGRTRLITPACHQKSPSEVLVKDW